MRNLVLAAALLAGCASAPASPINADLVIAAERAFAARADEAGWVPAFREYVAPDGQLGQPGGYANAPQTLAETPDDGNRDLFWWPAFAGIARSGDLGFTTGVVSADAARTPRGHYFTVWRRQPDGAWKWIYDGGVGPIAEPNLIAPNGAPASLAIAEQGAGSAAVAIAEVTALERAGALAERLAPDAQVFRSRLARAMGAAAPAAMAVPSGDVTYTLARIEASAAGDLAMVLGEARWSADGEEASGLFGRIWQRRGDGWRIVYDQLILPRPSPPPG